MKKTQYQRRPDGTYVTQPRHPVSGKRITLTGDSPAELDRSLSRLREARNDLRVGASRESIVERLAPERTRVTLVECWDVYSRGVNECSLRIIKNAWTKRIQPYLGTCCPWELEVPTMREWEQQLISAGYCRETIVSTYGYLQSCFNVAVVPGVCPSLPWGRWRPKRDRGGEKYIPKRAACTSLDQFRELTKAAIADDVRAWEAGRWSCWGVKCLVIGLSGLRQAEAAGLGWNCVDLDSDRPQLMVVVQARRGWPKRSKSGRPEDHCKTAARRVRLHPDVVSVLRQHRDQMVRREIYSPNGPVFPGAGGEWLVSGIVVPTGRVRRWAKVAGLPQLSKWTTHSLRHSFCTLELLASGGDLRSMMNRSGHADIRSAQGYVHAIGGAMPESSIPALGGMGFELRPSLPAPGEEVAELAALPEYPHPAEVAEVIAGLVVDHTKAGDAVRAGRVEAKLSAKELARVSLEDLAAAWHSEGCPGEAPAEVVRRKRSAYVRAYNRAREAGATREDCTRKAKMAAGQFMGAWGSAWRKWQKRAESAGEGTARSA